LQGFCVGATGKKAWVGGGAAGAKRRQFAETERSIEKKATGGEGELSQLRDLSFERLGRKT
jgi:hypothetical protein